MRIALICTEKLPVPPVAGGAIQIYIEGILPKLSLKHDITVFCISHPQLPEEEIKDGVKYIRITANNKTEYIKNIKLRIKYGDFDLIHIYNRPRWVNLLSKELNNTKFSLSLHNEMFHSEKITAEMAKDCINRVEFICTVSNFIADGIEKLFPNAQGKLHTVYSGVSIDKYVPVFSPEGIKNKEFLKSKLGIDGKRVVLFIGRLGVKKGVDKLIQAMKLVMNKYDDVALVVVGSKWYGSNEKDDFTNNIEEMSKKLSGPIIFTGFLSPVDIPKYYNVGDIFVCPSQWDEPLARVHYEAMAAGLPIITTNRGGNSEVIKGYGNGITIDDYSNSSELASNIIYFLENPEEAGNMGKKGRQIAEEKYNWDRVADDILDLFNKAQNTILPEIDSVPIINEISGDDVPDTTNIDVTEGIDDMKINGIEQSQEKEKKDITINFNEMNENKKIVKVVKKKKISKKEDKPIKIETAKKEEKIEEKKDKDRSFSSLKDYYLDIYKDFID